jgi:ATP-binding cassette subfamily B (MDR/TAP) protein 1
VLFKGTIVFNVAHGLIGSEHENASAEKKLELVMDACKQGNAHNFIMKLPN